jgi:hypothetical protein
MSKCVNPQIGTLGQFLADFSGQKAAGGRKKYRIEKERRRE